MVTSDCDQRWIEQLFMLYLSLIFSSIFSQTHLVWDPWPKQQNFQLLYTRLMELHLSALVTTGHKHDPAITNCSWSWLPPLCRLYLFRSPRSEWHSPFGLLWHSTALNWTPSLSICILCWWQWNAAALYQMHYSALLLPSLLNVSDFKTLS